MLTEEDIEILISQTGLSRELAKKLLIFKQGEIVECILEFEQYSPDRLAELEDKINSIQTKNHDDDIEKDVDTSKKENLIEYRNIVDSKDIIYNKKKEAREKMKKEKSKIQENKLDNETKKICNESIYYSTRNKNINMIKVL